VGYSGRDKRIIIKLILKSQVVQMWAGLDCLRIGLSGELPWTWNLNFGFQNRWGILE
jgi:hypothetical protein